MKRLVCALALAGSAFIFTIPSFAYVTNGHESGANWEVTYPIVSIEDNASAQETINADLDSYLEQLRGEFQSGQYYKCTERYTVHYEDNDVLSISIYQLRLPYGANGNHSNSFDLVYDKHSGARIPLDNYVHVTVDDLAEYKWAHSYTQGGKPLTYDEMKFSNFKSVPENYYLIGGGGVCIVFQPYQLAYGAAGCCYIALEPEYIEYLNRKNQW